MTVEPVEDSARRLRGEACSNCSNYSSLTGCWLAQQQAEVTGGPFVGGEPREADEWCGDWSPTMGGIHASVGPALDHLAQNFGVTRALGESDAALRQRVNALYAQPGDR